MDHHSLYTSVKPRQDFMVLIVILTLLLGCSYGWFVLSTQLSPAAGTLEYTVFTFKTLIEIVALFYGVSFIFVGIYYLFIKPDPGRKKFVDKEQLPPVGIIYLCYNDVERNAIYNFADLNYQGKIHLVIHDDSLIPSVQNEVNAIASGLQIRRPDLSIRVLRRPVKGGGKAPAVNYVLQETAKDYDYFILCDNDSMILDPATIQKGLDYFVADNIGIVQFRTIGIKSDKCCTANNYLRKCIDAFHVFMTVFGKYGWQPFVGHNAMLKTKYVVDIGGFTPGFFSDDLDMTIRLNLKGFKVAYAPDILMGETHPPSYASFRKRTYKWAYGCVQSLKAHFWAIMKSKRFSFAEKISFLFFTGFYFMQGILLFHLVFTFLVLPWFDILTPFNLTASVISGSLIILTIFFPFLAYFLKDKKLKENLLSLLFGGLVYGTTDFACIRGILDCMLKVKREWIPTNGYKGRKKGAHFSEALFGLALLIIPFLNFSPLLFFPSSFLFAGKFLFVPALFLLYDNSRAKAVRSITESVADNPKSAAPFGGKLRRATFMFFLLLLSLPVKGSAFGIDPEIKKIEVKEKFIFVNGEKIIIKGVQYSPWMPRTGPNKGYPYADSSQVSQDLTLIKNLGANTILVYDPPEYLLRIAARNNLLVIYTFAINWWAAGSDTFTLERQTILEKVRSLKENPNILAWQLGNEIPVAVLQNVKPETLEQELKKVYDAVKSIDPNHIISHGNWPPMKNLNLSFFDITGFNVYPVWPPEVVAQGYGNYISKFLQPISGNKPLLITEFGVNTLEAGEEGQAQMIESCWNELLAAGACGGIVFSFADEWWKNYDNTVGKDQWWFRNPAPDDELVHDLDPEEYYGIVTYDRKPKLAYHAVAKIFKEQNYKAATMLLPGIVIVLLILIAISVWFWSRKKSLVKSPA
ncbi:MAG: glycosyltransferase family 2 protein [Cyclobacteriaceae bacterium]